MLIESRAPELGAFGAGLLCLGRFHGAQASAVERAVDEALGGALSAAADRLRFRAKARQRVAIDTLGRLPCARVLLLGLGKPEEAGPAVRRDFGALAAVEALAQRLAEVSVVPPSEDAETLAQVAAGLRLGSYRFHRYQKEDPEDPRAQLTRATLHASADAGGALLRGEILAGAVNFARDLVNEPPNVCNPDYLVRVAGEIAASGGLDLSVLDEAALAEQKMGGILAVGGGSRTPPRLIHLRWAPPGADPAKGLALVGKGLTFDSGGLSLKTAKGMEDMYIDMAGAAAVLGAMRAVAALRPGMVVHGIVGAAENMPDGASYRPSDVLTMANGTTVEVLNTDAEGRLVLADCLHYATQQGPSAVVDLATLTGACMVALGPYYAGLMSDDESWASEVLAAGKAADELLWRLPLDPRLARTLESKRADLTNLGGPYGGAITGAQFLQRFKGETPWVHLDIAGASLADKEDGHIRPGGTGFGVLTLCALVEARAGR